jgi:DNA polymerase III epsilon subunit-like protein
MDEHLLRYDKDKTYVFIDCETLNLCLNSCHNLPWQIGMIKLVGDKIVDQKDIFIKWDTNLKISEDAARITRYDQKKVDRIGVRPEEIFATVEDWLDSADYIMGHNTLGFDVYLIKDYYKYMGKSSQHLYDKFIDTNAIAKGIKMGMPYKLGDNLMEYQYKAYHTIKKGVKTNLTALGKEFDIDVDYGNLHDAVNDLMLNIKVWDKLKWQIEI